MDKRIKKRAKKLGINYYQALYLSQKPPQWENLNSLAFKYDVDVEDHDEAFFLFSMGRSIAFNCNIEGIAQAIDWIEKEVAPKYNNRE